MANDAPARDERIASGARWLAEHWHVAPQPITRSLREMFGLGFNDAVKAMGEAKPIHRLADAGKV